MLDLTDGTSIAARQVSGFPLSLPTGLALESVFPRQQPAYDPERKIPQQIKVSDYQECWISVATLYRNMVNSVNKDVAANSSAQEFKEALESEIDVINGLFMNEGSNICIPRFYHCTYDHFERHLPSVIKLRVDSTDGQKAYTSKFIQVMKLMDKSTDEIIKFDHEIKPKTKTAALVLTHRPYELLSSKNFNKLDLLESNTGRLKTKYLWNTKYYPVGDSDMSILPFNRKLLCIFGDRVQIHPYALQLRKVIIEIAKKNRWTSLTSDAKVMFDLQGGIMDPYQITLLNSL